MSSAEKDVAQRVLRAQHEFAILQLDVQSTSSSDVKKAYRRLALLLHPDKNAAEDAKGAFIRLHMAFETLSDPRAQDEVLRKLQPRGRAGLSKPPYVSGAVSQPASTFSRKPGRPRSFMDVLREWEEFEREFTDHIVRQRSHAEDLRAERRRNKREEAEAAEAASRQALADALLDESSDEGDDCGLESRAANWNAFLKRKGRIR